jgi:competence protein ComEC
MKLRFGYLVSGITTGFIILLSFIWTLPDGRLHIVFCSVGQGDAAYVRFPDGRDMLVDGGPDAKVIDCLGRKIDIVVLTHPQKDHMQGIIPVFERFSIGYFLRSDVANSSEGYQALMSIVRKKHVSEKFLTVGDNVSIGPTTLSFIWPSQNQIAKSTGASDVLGATDTELNDYALVFTMRYGNFDALFMSDADSHIQAEFTGQPVFKYPVEILKVPHHGSKTGMTQDFIGWVKPELAVISVGKNTYGHPSIEAVNMLQSINSRILRTDKVGDIEVVSDGKNWSVIH